MFKLEHNRSCTPRNHGTFLFSQFCIVHGATQYKQKIYIQYVSKICFINYIKAHVTEKIPGWQYRFISTDQK